MSIRNLSLLRFVRRTPQPPVRTARGNFRYSAWTAWTYRINAGVLEQINASGKTVRLFLFGQDNVARGTVIAGNTTTFLTSAQPIETVSAYSAASTVIVPAAVPAAGESVYATINGIAGIRGVLAERGDLANFGAPASVVVDVTFDSGVVAGVANFTAGDDVFYRPVLLQASDLTQAIVDNGYVFTDSDGNTAVVVGVFEFVA